MVEEALSHVAVPAQAPAGRSTDYFGELVFGRNVMRRYLDRETYEALIQTHGTRHAPHARSGRRRGRRHEAVGDGARRRPTTPTGSSRLQEERPRNTTRFIEPDGRGGVIRRVLGQTARPAGARCVDVSPTAVSATRSRLAAIRPGTPRRPPSSSATTLCIPTVFIAYTGEALDYKTPLLKRSLAAVDKAAAEVCHYFDPRTSTKVFSLSGLGAGILPRR